MSDADFAALRANMVREILAHARLAREQIGKDSLAPSVIEALGRVPRHDFVPVELRQYAYVDSPLPIGYGKTISQPFIVALMTDMLDVGREDKVLEIGSGLGYQAAVLAELARQVFTVEIVEELAQEARTRLARLGYKNVEFKRGDGYYGWPEHGPFERIIVTASPELVPAPLLSQLKAGGRMVIPAGIAEAQQLTLVSKDANGRLAMREILPVRFSLFEPGERAEA
ncbi:MAG TPA: protein-L-isoaspartate(D-aspartate) O-methyltransferase [Alphaproteobacteria bacterium]|nr:protein-L-isoaspartate(D-aspartate) O-methyltransferase [Alphaproteobacteria bacterium]